MAYRAQAPRISQRPRAGPREQPALLARSGSPRRSWPAQSFPNPLFMEYNFPQVRIYIYICVCMYVCIYLYIRINCACMRVLIYVCRYMYVTVRIYVQIHSSGSSHGYTGVYTLTKRFRKLSLQHGRLVLGRARILLGEYWVALPGRAASEVFCRRLLLDLRCATMAMP